jgi:hypothetical protein
LWLSPWKAMILPELLQNISYILINDQLILLFTFWKSIILICISFLGVKCLIRTGTNFILLCSEVSIIKDNKYLALFKSSHICCIEKGARTFTTTGSHLVLEHVVLISWSFFMIAAVQAIHRNEKLCFITWRPFVARSDASSCDEILLDTLSSCSLIFVCCTVFDRPPCSTENDDPCVLQNSFPPAQSSVRTGNLSAVHP